MSALACASCLLICDLYSYYNTLIQSVSPLWALTYNSVYARAAHGSHVVTARAARVLSRRAWRSPLSPHWRRSRAEHGTAEGRHRQFAAAVSAGVGRERREAPRRGDSSSPASIGPAACVLRFRTVRQAWAVARARPSTARRLRHLAGLLPLLPQQAGCSAPAGPSSSHTGTTGFPQPLWTTCRRAGTAVDGLGAQHLMAAGWLAQSQGEKSHQCMSGRAVQ